MLYISGDKFGNSLCQIHCLFLKTLANTALTTIDGGTDANFWILAHNIKFIWVRMLFVFLCLRVTNLSKIFEKPSYKANFSCTFFDNL